MKEWNFEREGEIVILHSGNLSNCLNICGIFMKYLWTLKNFEYYWKILNIIYELWNFEKFTEIITDELPCIAFKFIR